jgi:long-chain acyl-CoA synthetase
MPATLHDELERRARLSSADVALVADGRATTVEQLLALAGRMTAALRATPCDAVICLDPDAAVFTGVVLAGLAVGLPVLVARSPKVSPEMLRRFPRVCGFAGPADGDVRHQLVRGPGDAGPPGADPRGGGIVIYTSGTSGVPVGVVTTELSFMVNADEMAPHVGDAERVFLGTSHATSYGVGNGIFLALSKGWPLHLVPHQHPRALVKVLAGAARSLLVATPAVFRGLLAEPAAAEALRARTSVRGFSSGDALNPALRREYLDVARQPLVDCYGSTETNGIAISREATGDLLWPLPSVAVRVRRQPPGDDAELMVSGPKTMRGYIVQAGASGGEARMRFEGEWLPTGDAVAWDPAKGLRLLGRRSTMLKINGNRLHAEEVERVLEELPEVEEAVAYVVPDEQGVPRLVADVRLRAACAWQVDRVRAHVAGRLPPYMVPRQLRVLGAREESTWKKKRAYSTEA